MVVACESLKPAGRRYEASNVYDVVEGLLGAAETRELRQLRLAPQRIRSRHLHRGELAAGELVPFLLQDIITSWREHRNEAEESGAVYFFTRSGSTWTNGAYIKGANTDAGASLCPAIKK